MAIGSKSAMAQAKVERRWINTRHQHDEHMKDYRRALLDALRDRQWEHQGNTSSRDRAKEQIKTSFTSSASSVNDKMWSE